MKVHRKILDKRMNCKGTEKAQEESKVQNKKGGLEYGMKRWKSDTRI